MIQNFINYLRSIRGYSENTIRAYNADIRSFARWANDNVEDARWSKITRKDIDKYLEYMQAQELKSSTTNRQISSISSLYRYMQREGLEVENPCKYESRRKVEQQEPRTIPVKAIAKAYNRSKGATKIMIGILASTGIRIQELLDLTWEDVDFDENTLRIKGKGSKERTVHTEKYVLDQWRELLQYAQPKGKIFYFTQRHARYLIYEALKPYSNSPALNPHAIRHTFATELAKTGTPTATIAKMLGHAHIETSEKYINMAEISSQRSAICLTKYN